MCFNPNILYNYNRKRGMNEFNIPERNLFCVNFDDSSIMDQFYKTVQKLDNNTLTGYVSSVSDPKLKSILVNTSLYFTVVRPQYLYLWGDAISLYNITKTTSHDIILYRKQAGAYGECVTNGVISYWYNIPTFSCKNTVVK